MRHHRLVLLAATGAVRLAAAAPAAHTELKSTSPAKGSTRGTGRHGHRDVHAADPARDAARHGPGRQGRLEGQRRPRPAQDLAPHGAAEGRQPAGRYTARWTIKAVDGHEQSGSFSSGCASDAAAGSRRSCSPGRPLRARPGPRADLPDRGRAGRPGAVRAARAGGDRGAHDGGLGPGPEGRPAVLVRGPAGLEAHARDAGDGSISVVRWRGRLASDGFARFAFIATTPEQEGELAWKAVQRYDDGEESAWIGPPDSDNPAPVTTVSAAAAAPERGRRGRAGRGRGARRAGGPAPAATDDADDSGTLGIVLGGAGLVLGAAALAVALRRRPREAA